MPLSDDYAWNIKPQNTAVHQMYGTKRKTPGFGDECESIQHDHLNGQHKVNMENNICKRRCIDHCGDSGFKEVNHNMASSQNLNFQSVQKTQSQGCFPSNQPSNGMFINPLVMSRELLEDDSCAAFHHNQPISANQLPIPEQQSTTPFRNDEEMIMNINDETYSRTNFDLQDEAMACNSMDSDCVPDPEQYNLNTNYSNYVGGETSQVPSKVKCFCRPSWEGIMEMRPYVSDYY